MEEGKIREVFELLDLSTNVKRDSYKQNERDENKINYVRLDNVTKELKGEK